MERRYRDYSQEGLTELQMGEALKRLRRMIPHGPRDVVNVDKTIAETMRNGGEISIVFDRRLDRPPQGDPDDRQRRLVDGPPTSKSSRRCSTTPVPSSRTPRSTISTTRSTAASGWIPSAISRPEAVEEFTRRDPDTRLIIVGGGDGPQRAHRGTAPSTSARAGGPEQRRSAEIPRQDLPPRCLAEPAGGGELNYTWTIEVIGKIFPMFELTLDGLDKAVQHLMKRN